MKDTENRNLVSIWCAGKKNEELIRLFEDLKKQYHYEVDANAWGEHGQCTKSNYDNILFVIHIDKDDDITKMKDSHDRYVNVMAGHKAILTSNSEDVRQSMPEFKVDTFVNISQPDKAKSELTTILERELGSKEAKSGKKQENSQGKMTKGEKRSEVY